MKAKTKQAVQKKRRQNNSRRDSSHYSNIFENNVNFRERVIYLNDDISDFSLELFQKAFDEFERGDNPGPVRIEVSSYGGSVYDMLGMIDRMRHSNCHVVTRGFGKIMSAATFILAAGDERIIGSNTWFMMHELSDWIAGTLKEQKISIKHNEALQNQMYKLYEKFAKGKTRHTTFKKLCDGQDCYKTAEETLKLGLVDRILEER